MAHKHKRTGALYGKKSKGARKTKERRKKK